MILSLAVLATAAAVARFGHESPFLPGPNRRDLGSLEQFLQRRACSDLSPVPASTEPPAHNFQETNKVSLFSTEYSTCAERPGPRHIKHESPPDDEYLSQ
jgi:hypothetical protein